MKNKKNIYILLPVVILVWGLLIYKIVAATKPNATTQELVATAQFNPLQLEATESFTINANYRDPFLGIVKKKKKIKPKTKKVTTKKITVPFPNIIYKGVVSPKGKNQQVYLISINGQQFFFKKNNINQKVKLMRGNNKEVVLKFQGQQQSFLIAK